MAFINKLSKAIVITFFGLFAIIYLLGNIFFTASMSNTASFEKGITIPNIIVLILMMLFVYTLINKDFFHIKEEYLLYSFLFICLLTGLVWIFINDVNLKELDDSYNCFMAAKNIAIGNLAPLSYKSYISVYPNNIGLVTYFLIHIKLFGDVYALYSIRLVNLVFVLLGYFALYRITRILFNDRNINCTLIILMFGSMQFVFFSFLVYGNCLSYSLSLLSVMFLLDYFKNNKIRNIILSGLLIIGSISIKQNSLIIFIAESILLIIYLINTKRIIIIIVLFLTLLGVYGGTTALERFWGNKVGIDYRDTRMPTICWLAYGLNYDERRPGGYFNEFEVYHAENGYMPGFTKIRAQTFIDGVLDSFKENPKLAIKFYSQKFLSSWANPQFEAFNQYGRLEKNEIIESVVDGRINSKINRFWDGISSLVAIGLIVFVLKKVNDIGLYPMVGMVVVIGGFLFHALWEVKAIYLYQYYMYLLPYAACGLTVLFRKGNCNGKD